MTSVILSEMVMMYAAVHITWWTSLGLLHKFCTARDKCTGLGTRLPYHPMHVQYIYKHDIMRLFHAPSRNFKFYYKPAICFIRRRAQNQLQPQGRSQTCYNEYQCISSPALQFTHCYPKYSSASVPNTRSNDFAHWRRELTKVVIT